MDVKKVIVCGMRTIVQISQILQLTPLLEEFGYCFYEVMLKLFCKLIGKSVCP